MSGMRLAGRRDTDRRVGGAFPLSVGPTGRVDPAWLEAEPYLLLHSIHREDLATLTEGLDAPLWDEVEEWDDAWMPPRAASRPPLDEWDRDNGIDPRWVVGHFAGRDVEGDPVEEPADARWPHGARCYCGYKRAEHFNRGNGLPLRCKGEITTIINGRAGTVRCACKNPEPLP